MKPVAAGVRLHRPPAVYRPGSDTRLLLASLRDRAHGRHVLELCAGAGVLSLVAACTAASVTAVDCTRQAVATIRLNAALNARRIDVRRGDLFAPVAGEQFDLVVANPPYMPTPLSGAGPRSVAWDAGWDGRAVLDRIASQAAAHLRPAGALLLVQSDFADIDRTAAMLAATGLAVRRIRHRTDPLGPVSRHRRAHLETLGVLDPSAPVDHLVVLEARRDAHTLTAAGSI